MIEPEIVVGIALGLLIGLPLAFYLRRRLRRGQTFSNAEIRGFAAELGARLLEQATVPGEWVQAGDDFWEQPYARAFVWRMAVFNQMVREGLISQLPAPSPVRGGAPSFQVGAQAWIAFHQARVAGAGHDGSDDGSDGLPPVPLCGCGALLDTGDPRFNLALPDPVAELSAEQQEQVVSFRSDQVVLTRTIGGFVRALLPIPLTDGRTVTLGVWISLEEDACKELTGLVRAENDATRPSFEGRLANGVEPYGDAVLAAPVTISSPATPEGFRTSRILDSTVQQVVDLLHQPRDPAEILVGERAWALRYDPADPPAQHAHH
ncbi:DUF2199 domain-containing protein [Kitasatospora sp. NPDC002040]|uniref:DUF2199 domain-containing protein n=1 Tax=Kitasatospora sp. NPDC002040 TaxID=3154661 RepID=UPI00332C1830